MAVLPRNQLAGGSLVANAVQMLESLAIDQSAEGARLFRHTARKQASDLVEQSPGELLIHAAGDAFRRQFCGQPAARRRSTRIPAIGDTVSAKCAVSGSTGEEEDLERANHPLAVAGQDPLADGRIDAAQHPMQERGARADRRQPPGAARIASSAAGPGNSPRVRAR